jgi:hypothetical protein
MSSLESVNDCKGFHRMQAYQNLKPYFGDLHSHCAISYGHGSLEEAFKNARQQLDFVSITGHAFWPDMPAPNAYNQYLIDFHVKGFKHLKENWQWIQELTDQQNEEGQFVTYLGFEMHSSESGDYTVIYCDGKGRILYSKNLAELYDKLRSLRKKGIRVIAFPHHMGYRQGHRGINWDTYQSEFSPVVEMISMHGCSETDESARPYLHTMGPLDNAGTIQFGLQKGHIFGFIGSTDHHSAHPGSYGHGLTGLWAEARTRNAIWDALLQRRTYALTGDKIQLEFSLNDDCMGAVIPYCHLRRIEVHIIGGGAIDYVDVVKNNKLLYRFSECDVPNARTKETLETKLFLEFGWGPRNQPLDWKALFGISAGRILAVEPRFRGQEVVSPVDNDPGSGDNLYRSQWRQVDERNVHIQTVTFGNPNNFTPGTQGICLHVEMPRSGSVSANINDKTLEIPIEELLQGAHAEPLKDMPAPSFRIHRAILPSEFDWLFAIEDESANKRRDSYYVRIRQKNDQWAWSSPIFVESAKHDGA